MAPSTPDTHDVLGLEPAERPRERLAESGVECLTSIELVALVMGVGIPGEGVLALARRLLGETGGISGLARLSFDELRQRRGLGNARAARLQAALALGRRLSEASPDQPPAIRTASDAARLLVPRLGSLTKEHLVVVLLNARHRVLRVADVCRGTVDGAPVRVADVFQLAVHAGAIALIVAHNHPSGELSPSAEDVALTEDIVKAGRLLGIGVLDHIIVAGNRWVSLRAESAAFAGGRGYRLTKGQGGKR